MRATKTLKRSEILEGEGPLPALADRAMAAGFRFFTLKGKVFELETGRTQGSSLGLHSINAVLTE